MGNIDCGGETTGTDDGAPTLSYLHGTRFWLVALSHLLMVFLVNLEVLIVTTSLFVITNDLGGFNTLSWVVSSYLLGYVSIIVAFSKFSNIFGWKPIFAISIIVFIIFSGACGGVQTIIQLIIFRAFQSKYTKYFALLSTVSTLLVVSTLLWIILGIWERKVTLASKVREQVLLWRFLTDRFIIGVLFGTFFVGGPTVVSIFRISETSTLSIPLGTIRGLALAGKLKIPPIYVIITGAILQVTGFALIGTLPLDLEVPARFYGYELIAGFGCGLASSLFFLVIPFVVEMRDKAVALGAAGQFRMIGGTVALAVATSLFNSSIDLSLTSIAEGPVDFLVSGSGDILNTLPCEVQVKVKLALAQGYNYQLFSVASPPCRYLLRCFYGEKDKFKFRRTEAAIV
ncbi:putative multidrug resistance protein fnx1 [Xylaria digitata]|nr:putative multidrug resistance protein fnx1 [Xylaria digitata]